MFSSKTWKCFCLHGVWPTGVSMTWQSGHHKSWYLQRIYIYIYDFICIYIYSIAKDYMYCMYIYILQIINKYEYLYMYTYLYIFRCCTYDNWFIDQFKALCLNSHFGGWSDDLKVFVICTFKPNISSYLFRSWKSPITYDQFESEFCGWFRCGHCAGHCSSGWVQYARACGSLRRQLTLKCWQWWCPYHDSIIGHRVFPTATTKSMRQESHPRHKETTKD